MTDQTQLSSPSSSMRDNADLVGLCQPDFHGASVIDAQGREIPITESMIQRACQVLIRAWEQEQARHT